jgi:hypothetical protein
MKKVITMKKVFFYELPLQLVYLIVMKTEKIITATGVLLSVLVYFIFNQQLISSSPLPLILMGIMGWLLILWFYLAGSLLLFSAGAALVVHPLIFSSVYWLIPGGLLMAYAGFSGFIKWWKQNGN